MDKEDSPSVPPRKGDLLFRDDLPDWHNNACLNVSLENNKSAYLEGYRRGARLLVKYVNEEARDQDFLVYPVIFLYRHHIELALKNIIMQAPYVLGRELTATEKSHLKRHQLEPLWRDLKPIWAELCKAAGWNGLDPAEVEGIEDYIKQLSDMDADSFAFRYAQNKQGAPSLDPELKCINLRHFADHIERLADYLDEMDAALYSLAEMEAEYRSEMAQYMDYE